MIIFVYCLSAVLQGLLSSSDKQWDKPWFTHTDLMNGEILKLVMVATPNKNRGSDVQNAPPSELHVILSTVK